MAGLKNGWDKVKAGDTMMVQGNNGRWVILEVLHDAFAYCGAGDQSSISWGRKSYFESLNYKIIGAEWEKAESAIEYLQSKGLIKDGKVITG